MKKKELVRKGLLVGVGIAAYAQEKTEKFVKELVKKENLNRAEGKKLVKAIYQEADSSWKRLVKVAEEELKKLLKTAHPAKKAKSSVGKKRKR